MATTMERSFRGRVWEAPIVSPDAISGLIGAGIPIGVAPILAARGFDAAAAASHLNPKIRDLMPPPSFFLDMEKAVDRLTAAITAGQSIAIWGDYDVDGATSSALLRRFLGMCGVESRIHIPDRVLEGYGPNRAGLENLKANGVDLVCILDSGTLAFEALDRAAAIGLDIIVIDHHLAKDALPKACAIVNPNRLDQEPGYNHLCAAGMTFMLCVGVNARLRVDGFHAGTGTTPDLMGLLDLVALGTVCDVVALNGLNRAFVQSGLQIMARRTNPGIDALARAAQLEGDFNAYHCGFMLGPRINAGGRIGISDTGANLLSIDDGEICLRLARQLDAWNKERQDLEKQCTDDARRQVDEGDLAAAVFAIGEDWHEGVIGIVASRLKDAYDRPSFCFSSDGEVAKGSGRSVPGFHLGRMILAAVEAGILVKGGGHAMAGGVTVALDKYQAFQDFMSDAVSESEFARTGIVTKIDAVVSLEQISAPLAEALSVLEPYGQGNPTPRFLVRSVRLSKAEIVKEQHLKIELVGASGRTASGIAFGAAGTPLADGVMAMVGDFINIVATLKLDEWRGNRRAQLMIEDARPGAADAMRHAAE